MTVSARSSLHDEERAALWLEEDELVTVGNPGERQHATRLRAEAGALRARFIAAGAPFVQDAVIAGHDRDFIAVLVFPRLDQCRGLCVDPAISATASEVLSQPAVRARFQELIDRLAREATGSATRIERALLLDIPPSIDAGEITDKGSINQRAVLDRRAALVEELYAENPSPRVLCVTPGARQR